jgi:DNA polymerase-3 subunit alpha
MAMQTNVEPLPEAEAWSHTGLLTSEKTAIGFYITGHPLENYIEVLNELKCLNSMNLNSLEHGAQIRMGGIVTALQLRATKKGDRFALLRLEDQTGGVKCVIWPDIYNKCSHLLADDNAVLISGKLDLGDEGAGSIIADEVEKLEDVWQRRARAVLLRTAVDKTPEVMLDELFKVLDRFRGDCEVIIEMYLEGGVLVRTRAHGALRVEGSLQMEAAVRELGYTVEWLSGERAA